MATTSGSRGVRNVVWGGDRRREGKIGNFRIDESDAVRSDRCDDVRRGAAAVGNEGRIGKIEGRVMEFDRADDGAPKSERPGRKIFSPECKVVLGRFIIGDRGPDVIHHIENCRPCGIVVFGDGRILPTSIFDDVERRRLVKETRTKDEGRVLPSVDVLEMALDRCIFETQVICNSATVPGDPKAVPIGGTKIVGAASTDTLDQKGSAALPPREEATIPADAAATKSSAVGKLAPSRRRVLKFAVAAAAVALVGGSVAFFNKRSDAGRTQKSAATGLVNGPAVSGRFAQWDIAYAGGNVAAVRTLLARANAKDLFLGFDWIAERRVAALYLDLLTYLLDPNIDTRGAAVRSLYLLPAVSLKPHLINLQNARNLEPDPGLQAALDELILTVMKS